MQSQQQFRKIGLKVSGFGHGHDKVSLATMF
jgi:hypothetical protein